MNQSDLFEKRPPAVLWRPTSVAAAESMRGRAGAVRAQVLRHIEKTGGSTCDEIEEALGLAHQTASARVNELMNRKCIVDVGRRATRSGRLAIVWRSAR